MRRIRSVAPMSCIEMDLHNCVGGHGCILGGKTVTSETREAMEPTTAGSS